MLKPELKTVKLSEIVKEARAERICKS